MTGHNRLFFFCRTSCSWPLMTLTALSDKRASWRLIIRTIIKVAGMHGPRLRALLDISAGSAYCSSGSVCVHAELGLKILVNTQWRLNIDNTTSILCSIPNVPRECGPRSQLFITLLAFPHCVRGNLYCRHRKPWKPSRKAVVYTRLNETDKELFQSWLFK